MCLNEKLKNYLKLLSSGILMMWLFIQSPLNPLYCDYNNAELSFIKLHFLYWVLFTVFALWFIFFIDQKNFEKKLSYIIVYSTGLYFLFFIFYGFDVTDTGYHLSKQWAMFHGRWKENFDYFAGTNFIGGLWLIIPGKPLLIWARVGFVIIQVSVIFISYKVLTLYFKPKQAATVLLPLCIFLAIWQLYFTINYDNLSFLFFLLSTYLTIKGLMCVSNEKKYFFFSGLFTIVTAFCKITYLPAILFIIFLIFLDNVLYTKENFKLKIIYLLSGFLCGVGTLAGILLLSGGMDPYINYFSKLIIDLTAIKDIEKDLTFSQDHSFSSLYSLYKSHTLDVINHLYKFIFIIILIEFFRIKAKSQRILKNFILLAGFFMLFYSIFEINYQNEYTENNFRYIISFFSSVYILWVISTENRIIKKYLVLITASAGLFLFSFLGSDLAFRAAFHAGSGLLLFSLPVILIKESELVVSGYKIKFTFLYYFVIIAFSLNIINKKDNLYREPGFEFLNTPFQTSSLLGIKSSPQRVNVTDSLMIYLSTIPGLKEKTIFFSHHNVLMYYLTDTNYFLNSPWDVLNDYNYLKAELIKNKPKIFVKPKESHRFHNWPFIWKSKDYMEKAAAPYYDFYNKFIKENNYEELYGNSFYTVYELKDENRIEK